MCAGTTALCYVLVSLSSRGCNSGCFQHWPGCQYELTLLCQAINLHVCVDHIYASPEALAAARKERHPIKIIKTRKLVSLSFQFESTAKSYLNFEPELFPLSSYVFFVKISTFSNIPAPKTKLQHLMNAISPKCVWKTTVVDSAATYVKCRSKKSQEGWANDWESPWLGAVVLKKNNYKIRSACLRPVKTRRLTGFGK